MDWILDLLTQLGPTSNYIAIADFPTLQFTVTHTSVISLHQSCPADFSLIGTKTKLRGFSPQASYTDRELQHTKSLIFTAALLKLTVFFTVGISTINSLDQSQSYVTTDGRSASLSWYKAPIWGLRPDL
jgi:hypothetical protein